MFPKTKTRRYVGRSHDRKSDCYSSCGCHFGHPIPPSARTVIRDRFTQDVARFVLSASNCERQIVLSFTLSALKESRFHVPPQLINSYKTWNSLIQPGRPSRDGHRRRRTFFQSFYTERPPYEFPRTSCCCRNDNDTEKTNFHRSRIRQHCHVTGFQQTIMGTETKKLK